MTSLHGLVQESLATNSRRVAILYDDGNVKCYVTYQELWNKANTISCVLGSLGVDNETIGLCMAQTADLPSVILGILKTPASFYPFDGDGPVLTRKSLVQLGVRYILVHIDLLEKVDEITHTLHGAVVPCMELLDFGLVLLSLPKVTMARQKASLAYCITTSGTTSSPKVVRVPHRCIVPNITHIRDIFKTTKDDLCFLASPLTFDPSIVEMFVALTSGAAILITSSEVKASPEKLLNILYHRNSVSILQMTPTLLMRFQSSTLESTLLSSESSLRILALGGEKFPSLDVFRSCVSPDSHTKFYNLYGITEVSTWATCFGFDAAYLKCSEVEVPLGTVLEGTKVKVIDSEGHEIKNGEGQLLIGSRDRVCLLSGETVEDVKDGVMWRHTGDIVNVSRDLSITYIGRHDDQIKRHGKRLNMAAVEDTVQQLPSVEDSRVIFSENCLLLFLVAKEGSDRIQHATFKMEVKSHLQKSLPSHYQPDEMILIDAIPVTKHGKTDKTMLLSYWEEAKRVRVIPQENVQQWCQMIWKDFLDLPMDNKSIQESDEFLALGGDSLNAVNILNCVESVTGAVITSLLDTLLNRTFQDFVQEVQDVVVTRESKQSLVAGKYAQEESIENTDNVTESEIDSRSPTVPSSGDSMIDSQVSDHTDHHGSQAKEVSSSKDDPQNISETPEHECRTSEQSEQGASLRDSDVLGQAAHSEVHSKSAKGVSSSKEGPQDISEGQGHDCRTAKQVDQTAVLNTSDDHGQVTSSDVQAMSASYGYNMNDSVIGCMSRGSRYEGQLTADILLSRDLPEDSQGVTLEQCWKYDTGKCVDASPLVAVNRSGSHVVYLGSHSHAMCAVDLTTGSEVWRTQLGDRVESSACLSQCGRWVVVGCYDNCVYVLCATSGSIKWKYRTDGCVKSSPTLDPVTSHIIVGSHDQCLHAINIKEEVCIWKRHLGTGSIFSSPCASRYHRHVYVGTLGSHLHAVNTDTGSVIWSCSTSKPIFSSPAENHQCVVIGCVDGSMYCFSHLGHKMWTFPTTAPVFSSPTIVSLPHHPTDIVLVGSHDKHLYCVSMTGEELWKWEADSAIYSTPFVLNQRQSRVHDTKTKMAATAPGPAAETAISTEIDICRNFHKASLEKQLHLQTELSNGVTFASEKYDPAKFALTDDDAGNHCSADFRYSMCVACSSLETNGEPCMKKQRFDTATIAKSDSMHNSFIQSYICGKPSLCGSVESSGKHLRSPRYSYYLNPKGSLEELTTDAFQMERKQFVTRISSKSLGESNSDMHVQESLTMSSLTDSEQVTKVYNDQQAAKERHDVNSTKQNLTSFCHCQKLSEETSFDAKHCIKQSPLVCVGSTSGTLTVLDGTTGRPVASAQLPGEVFSSPVAIGQYLVVGCRDDYIYCLNISR